MTAEVPLWRKALAVAALAAGLFAAVVVQLTVVNRLPLPGAAAPDLVLLLVTAVAVATSPARAAVTGFAGGLALDVAPPAAHYAGEYALVFCLAAYAAARVHAAIMNTAGERDPVTVVTVMAVAAVAGEAGKAALGLLLSDPDVTTAAASRVLPAAVLYDLLLAPLACWLVARIAGAIVYRNTAPEPAPVPEFSRDQRLASVFRSASTGAAPNLRLAGTGLSLGPQSPPRRVPDLRLAGTGADHRTPSVAGRTPKLRLADGSSRSLSRTGAAFSGTPGSPLGTGRTSKVNFAGDLQLRPARTPRSPGRHWLRSAVSPALGTARRSPRRPAGWLGAAGASGLASSLGTPRSARRAARLAGVRIGRPRGNVINVRNGGASPRPAGNRRTGLDRARIGPRRGDVINGRTASGFPAGFPSRRKGVGPRKFGRGTLGTARPGTAALAPPPRTAAETLAARSAPSGLSALSGAGTPVAGRRRPQPGWLRGTRIAPPLSARHSPRSGWLGSSRRPRTVIGSRVGASRHPFRHTGTAGGNWYTASPSGTWLRRSRHSWRKRSQELLRLVGVGK